MSRLARKKYAGEDHDNSNLVCKELKADLKVTTHTVVTIGKLIQKEGAGKEGPYTRTIWMVQLILKNIVNGMPTEDTSLNIASQDALAMLGVKVIVQELPSIIVIWK